MTDSYVQVAIDGSGKKVATTEITRSDGSTVVEIQEVLPRGIVSDAPSNYLPDDIQPLSLTTQGQLMVASVDSDFGRVWQDFGNGGWSDDPPSAAQNKFPSAGAC